MSGSQPRIAIFPGSFDPITCGHLDIIRRGRNLFDQLIVAIGKNPTKTQLLSMVERKQIIEQLLVEEQLDVQVECFDGLTVEYAAARGAAAILRGVRNLSDMQFEIQLALTNRAMADIETVFVVSGREHVYTSSSLIRQIALSGRADRLVSLLPKAVVELIRSKVEQIEHPERRPEIRNDAHIREANVPWSIE